MVLTLGALKNFADFTGKIHVLESPFKKDSGPQACKFIKKRLQHSYFPVKLTRFSRALFFTEHLRWLVFKTNNSNKLFKRFFRDTSYPEQISYHLQLSQWQTKFKNAFTYQKLVPIERFCNRFRTNSKGSDLNINNFAVLLHFRIT